VINSVHINKRLKAEDFALKVPHSLMTKNNNGGGNKVKANVIGVIENQAPTKHLVMELEVDNGQVHTNTIRDVAKLALIQRHKGGRGIKLGLVKGFGLTGKCAIASTVAHDSHNLIVVGTDESEMAVAANKLVEVGGGQVVVREGKIIGLVELEIAGLMSSERAGLVAKKAETVLAGFRACGCNLNNPNMQLSLLALVVIPELRLSDKGLVNVKDFDFIPVLEKVN
jgi:adenine deaminase